MGDGWAWAAYLYDQQEDEMTMSNQFEDDKIMAGYVKASTQQQHINSIAGIGRQMPINPGGTGAGGNNTPGSRSYQTVDKNKALSIAKEPDVTVIKHEKEHDVVSLEFTNIPNEQAYEIITTVLPNVMQLYMSKSRDYGGNVMAMLRLGPKASFVDLWRKVGKLKRALWDGEPMKGEQPDEILADCVGHILITMHEMRAK